MKPIRITSRVHWMSRRAFLGGASALVALPAFETLNAKFAMAQAAKPPMRFLSWYFPCGVPSSASWPTLLEGLDPVKTKFSILTGMSNIGGGPDHARGTRSYLTGNHAGPSFDQVLGDELAKKANKAPVHSLQLGVPDTRCEPGAPCTFMNDVTWRPGGVVLPKQMRPDLAFDSLFKGASPVATDTAGIERAALRKSVLDLVRDDAQNLSRMLSKSDNLRMDEYLSSIRATEAKIAALGSGGGAGGGGMACGKAIAGLAENGNVFKTAIDSRGRATLAQLELAFAANIEVMALALQCDLTRVISFMAGSGGSAQHNLGTGDDYHLGIGHAGKMPEFRAVVTWHMKKLGEFLTALDSRKEADGTSILDNSVLFSSSEINEGGRHNHDNMPIVLAGGLGGKLKLGGPRAVGNRFVDLFAFLGEQMGAPVTGFGTAAMIKGLT